MQSRPLGSNRFKCRWGRTNFCHGISVRGAILTSEKCNVRIYNCYAEISNCWYKSASCIFVPEADGHRLQLKIVKKRRFAATNGRFFGKPKLFLCAKTAASQYSSRCLIAFPADSNKTASETKQSVSNEFSPQAIKGKKVNSKNTQKDVNQQRLRLHGEGI